MMTVMATPAILSHTPSGGAHACTTSIQKSVSGGLVVPAPISIHYMCKEVLQKNGEGNSQIKAFQTQSHSKYIEFGTPLALEHKILTFSELKSF